MYCISLTNEQRQDLQRRTRQTEFAPSTRDRLEMVRLSDASWSVPTIARHLGQHEQTVRAWIKAFLAGGFDALRNKPRGGKQSALTPAILEAVRTEVTTSQRTWTAAQIADWVAEQYGVRVSAGRLRVHLKRAKLSYQRTSRSLKHKQHPDEVAERQVTLETLEKKGDAGLIDLCHLDEAGFSMTLPTTYSWFPTGTRLCVPYEAPQGRRLNAIGAHFPHGPLAGGFVYQTWASLPKRRAKQQRKTPEAIAAAHGLAVNEVGPIDAARFLAFVWQVAGRPHEARTDWQRARPLMIVLDNYSVHKSQTVEDARPQLEAADVHLVYLPAYCPELSAMEPVWNDVKQHHLPIRSFEHVAALKRAVDTALACKADQLQQAYAQTTNVQRAAT